MRDFLHKTPVNKLAAMLCLLVCTAPSLAEWQLAGDFGGPPSVGKFYLDLSTVTLRGKKVRIWELRDYFSKQTSSDGMAYSSVKVFNEFDCEEKTHRYVSAVFYSQNLGLGKIIFQLDSQNEKPSYVVPNTVQAAQLSGLCRNFVER